MSEQLVSLVVFAVAMTFSPGPNNVLMATSGVQVGLRGSVPLGAGIVTGMALLMGISAIGLGTVVEQSPALQLAMKTVGSAYLLWLGMHIARPEGIDLSNAEGRPRRGFRAGFLNTLLNLK